MKPRAILFDIYGTLLEVGPPPPAADARWQRLCRDLFHAEPRLRRLDFSIACQRVIARCHEADRARGIPWPEVHWPSVVGEVLPEWRQLAPQAQEEFLLRQVQTGRTARLSDAAAAALRQFREAPGCLGIASNAQAYTRHELADALAAHSLGLDLFQPDLCFWSYEHGFSKPDPHVCQILTARLAARGIAPAEILLVGDRLDNDILPARAHGWQAWHLQATSEADWPALLRACSH